MKILPFLKGLVLTINCLLAFFLCLEWVCLGLVFKSSNEKQGCIFPQNISFFSKKLHKKPQKTDTFLSSIPLQIPDLRKDLIFYGNYTPPGQRDTQSHLILGLRNQENSHKNIAPKQSIALKYANEKWSFKDYDKHSDFLWITATLKENKAAIRVHLKNPKGQYIQEPKHLKDFFLDKETLEEGQQDLEAVIEDIRIHPPDLLGGKHLRLAFCKHMINLSKGDLIGLSKEKIQLLKHPETFKEAIVEICQIERNRVFIKIWSPRGYKEKETWIPIYEELWDPTDALKQLHFFRRNASGQSLFISDKKHFSLSKHQRLIYTNSQWVLSETLETPYDILYVHEGLLNIKKSVFSQGTVYNPLRSQGYRVLWRRQNLKGDMTPDFTLSKLQTSSLHESGS